MEDQTHLINTNAALTRHITTLERNCAELNRLLAIEKAKVEFLEARINYDLVKRGITDENWREDYE